MFAIVPTRVFFHSHVIFSSEKCPVVVNEIFVKTVSSDKLESHIGYTFSLYLVITYFYETDKIKLFLKILTLNLIFFL